MRLEWDARARRLLRRLPVRNVYSVAELALIAALAAQAARLVWALATPVTPLGDWRAAEPVTAGQPGEILSGFDPFFRLSGVAAGPATVSALPIRIFGIRVDEAMGRGSAIVAGPDGVQKSVGVGEEIMAGVKLTGVAFDHITIDRGGAAEDVFLDQSAAVQPVQPGAPTGAAPGAPAATVSVDNIRSEIGFIPRIDGGRVSGLTVRPQGTGAAFRAAGLQEGDVITGMGNRPISGQGDFERLRDEYKNGGSIPLTVERGGSPLALAIPVAPK